MQGALALWLFDSSRRELPDGYEANVTRLARFASSADPKHLSLALMIMALARSVVPFTSLLGFTDILHFTACCLFPYSKLV